MRRKTASEADRLRLALVLEESPKLVVAFQFFQEGAKAAVAILESELGEGARRELAQALDEYVLHTFGTYYVRCQERKAKALQEPAPDLMPVTAAPPPSAA